MITIVFFPPIADRIHNVEHSITAADNINILNFIELLKKEPMFTDYFKCIAKYGSGSFLKDVIVAVNGTVVDELFRVHDGDVVNILLPFAGGRLE